MEEAAVNPENDVMQSWMTGKVVKWERGRVVGGW
jgi:hypothetical protein